MSKKIMLVDDSKVQLDICMRYLQDKYEVICCESGIQAVATIKEYVPDAILLDIDMPHMDGYDTLRKLRETEAGANIPIIGLTGESMKAAVLKFMSMGGNGYLVKPAGQQQIIEMLEKHLNMSENMSNQKKVLVVDDDMDTLRIIQTMLKKKYTVTALNSSKLALEFLYKHRVDAIVIDYYMAPYTGEAVIKMIRNMDNVKDVPIAMITGTSDRQVLKQCAILCPGNVIRKPVNEMKLLDKVEQMLAKAERKRLEAKQAEQEQQAGSSMEGK